MVALVYWVVRKINNTSHHLDNVDIQLHRLMTTCDVGT